MNQTIIDQLRALANFLEANPDLPTPSLPDLIVASKEHMIEAVRLTGAKKRYDETYFYVDVPVGDFTLQFFCSRETVCTPTKTVEEVIPAQPEFIRRKVVEWECHPLLKPEDFVETIVPVFGEEGAHG